MVPLRRGSCHYLLIFLSALFLLSTAKADDWPPLAPEDLAMKTFPQLPGAAAVVLLRDETSDDAHNHVVVYQRIKILNETGRRYADVEIPYSRRNFTIYDVAGRTIHPDGTIIAFSGKPFDKVVEKLRNRGREERIHVKSFSLPDVQVGSVIEYRYHLSYDDHNFYPPDWEVQTDLFQKKVKFKFMPYSGELILAHDRVGSGIAWTSYLPKGSQPVEHVLPQAGISSRRTPNSYVDLEMSDVPPLIREPDMPPTRVLRYRVNFYYMVGQKQEQYWKDEGKFWNKDVEGFVGRKSGVSEVVSQTVAASDTPEQKARKLYEYVTKLDNWTYQPPKVEQEQKALGIKADRGAEDVLRQHGGDHDDLNRLYVALLRSAGLPAWMMWVPSRDQEFFDPAYLSTRQLVAEIAIIQLDGKELFLDPGSKFCPFGLLDWRYSNVKGIRQREGKGTEISESNLPDYNKAMVQRLARLQMTAEGRAEGNIKVGFYGLEAMERRREASKTDAEGRKKMLEDEVKRWLPADSDATLTNTPDWDATEPHLAAEFKISTPLAIGSGKRVVVPVHLFQVNDKPRFSASDRTNSIYFDYLWREIDEVHVTFPADLEVESLPASDSVRLDYALYKTNFKQENPHAVTAVRDLTIGGLAFPPDMYKEIKGFFDKVKTGDDQPVLAKAAAHADLK